MSENSTRNVYRRLVDHAHKILGKSAFFSRVAVSLYFHTRRIFKYHLSGTVSMIENGEELLIGLIAEKVKTFVDVGANVGEWTKKLFEYSDSPKQGFLYEPSPTVFKILEEKLGNYKSLYLRPFAVGDHEGQATLHENTSSTNVSSLISPRGSTETTQVKVVSLNKDLGSFNLEAIDCLKIDTEGYDFHALRGATDFLAKQSIGLIQFEYSHCWIPASSTLKAAINFLESYGYEVLLLKSDGLYKLNYDWYGEYFQYSNFLAISPAWKWIKEDLYRGTI